MIFVGNAFSLQMLPCVQGQQFFIQAEVVLPGHVRWCLDNSPWASVIGHADLARLASQTIGLELPVNRISVSLQGGDTLFVAQYTGPRLPEGATSLPEGASIVWWRVDVLCGRLVSQSNKEEKLPAKEA